MSYARLLAFCLASLFWILPGQTQDAIPQPRPRPMPAAVMREDNLRLEFYFASMAQGGIGLIRLQGEQIRAASLSFLGEEAPFFHVKGDGWYALALVGMDARTGEHGLTVAVKMNADEIIFERDIDIDAAGYIRQDFNVPDDRLRLIDRAVEEAEFARLNDITAAITAEMLWDATGFALPLDTELSSPFGAYRLLNGTMQTRHTGWDQRAAVGTPVRAMAAGAVAFADRLDIRGNYVMIDHGHGVYSGYAHFSEVNVTRGQSIAAGQVIGMSGNSGRSSGPHLHWEVAVRGQWVTGLALVEMWLPA